MSQSGELVSKIPDIDPTLTATISDRLKDATTEVTGAVSNAVSRIQEKFDAISANLDDPTEAVRPLYHPRVTFIGFIQDDDSISLVQRRQTELREGTACTVRQIATQRWNAME